MDSYMEEWDYKNLKNRGTGSHGDMADFKIIPYPFDKYQIKVKLTPTNEFIGIVEVGIKRIFYHTNKKQLFAVFMMLMSFIANEGYRYVLCGKNGQLFEIWRCSKRLYFT
jgi:hypothetical protein